MQYQVFVQNLAAQRFVASVMEMPTISEYGATEEEAVSRATEALKTKLAIGKLITIELPQTVAVELQKSKPQNSKLTMQYAGIFANDPSFDDWVEKLKLIRTEANTEE